MLARIKRRPKLAALLVVVLALVFAGVGYAIWSMTTSTNKLQGKVAGTVTLTIINPTAGDLAAAAQCVPGGSCDILGEVSNPSTAAVKIVSYAPTQSAGFAGTGACDASMFGGPAESTSSVTLASPITVPGGAVNQVVTLPAALTLNSNSVSSCQGSLVTETGGNIVLTYTAGT